jgi:hypothetical protein
MGGSNGLVNDQKRAEMGEIFTVLKKLYHGDTHAVAEKLKISAAQVNRFASGKSMGNNALREKAKNLLKFLSQEGE